MAAVALLNESFEYIRILEPYKICQPFQKCAFRRGRPQPTKGHREGRRPGFDRPLVPKRLAPSDHRKD